MDGITIMKILCVIKTGINHKETRIPVLEKTWTKHIDYLYFSDYEDSEYDMIKTTNNSTYVGAGEKGINFLNMIKDIECNDGKILDIYDWIFYVDDDTFVNVNNLKEFIKTADKNKIYGYIFDSEKNPDNPMYQRNVISKTAKFPSGGAGVLIGSEVLNKIPKFELFVVPSFGHDDVDMGLNFQMFDVEQIDPDLFNSQNPEFHSHGEDEIKKSITYHHIDADLMYSLYEMTYEVL